MKREKKRDTCQKSLLFVKDILPETFFIVRKISHKKDALSAKQSRLVMFILPTSSRKISSWSLGRRRKLKPRRRLVVRGRRCESTPFGRKKRLRLLQKNRRHHHREDCSGIDKEKAANNRKRRSRTRKRRRKRTREFASSARCERLSLKRGRKAGYRKRCLKSLER